jgi:hypothetical protein
MHLPGRTSTWLITAFFLVTLATYLFVRPPSPPPVGSTPGVTATNEPTHAPSPTPTVSSPTPTPTTPLPTVTPPTPSKGQSPTSTPTATSPTPVPSSPATTSP